MRWPDLHLPQWHPPQLQIPDWGYPFLFGILAIWIGWISLQGFQKGEAMLPHGGGTYSRETQPKMFWFATSINAFYVVMMSVGSVFFAQDTIQKRLIAACDAKDGQSLAFYRAFAKGCDGPLHSIWATDSTRLVIYKNRAYALLRANDDEAAIKDLSHAIAIDSTDSWAVHTRGALYKDVGLLSKAAADYEAALRLEPNDRNAMRDLASVYLWFHEPDKAVAILNRLVKLQPKDTTTIKMLSRAYAMEGDCAAAHSWADSARIPDDPAVEPDGLDGACSK